MVVHGGSANQRLPVLETHHIPLEQTGRTLLILVCVVSIEERVQETLLFGLPSGKLTRRTGLRALPSTPFNARCNGFAHSSPPLLDRTALTMRPVCFVARSFQAHSRFHRKEDARRSTELVIASCGLLECQVAYVFQSVAGIRWFLPGPAIGCLVKAG
jgi:hypothetical protein